MSFVISPPPPPPLRRDDTRRSTPPPLCHSHGDFIRPIVCAAQQA